MKNLFAIKKKENEKNNYDKFVSRKLSSELSDELEGLSNHSYSLTKKSQIPLWLGLIKLLSLGFGLLICIIIFIPQEGLTIQKAYHNAPYLFYIGPSLVLIGVIIIIIEKCRYKKVEKSEELDSFQSKGDLLLAKCQQDLNIPVDAKKMDFFVFMSKTKKDGKEKLANYGLFNALNNDLSIFKEDDNLCIAFTDIVLSLPLNSFKKIVEVKKNIVFYGWNKDIPYNKEPYKEYKIKVNQYGGFIVKGYYSVQFEYENEEYEFFIPKYELNTIQEFLNLEVETLENKK